MKKEDVSNYNKESETKFKVERDYYLGISKIICDKQDLIECLDYIQASAFFPIEIKLLIDTTQIILNRHNYSGRKYIDETKSNMYDENYPQKWNDVRLYNEIIEILSHQ